MATAVHPYIEALLSGTRELAATPHRWLDERLNTRVAIGATLV